MPEAFPNTNNLERYDQYSGQDNSAGLPGEPTYRTEATEPVVSDLLTEVASQPPTDRPTTPESESRANRESYQESGSRFERLNTRFGKRWAVIGVGVLAAGSLVACNALSDTDQESAGRQSEPAAAAPETTTSTITAETSLPPHAAPTTEAASTELLRTAERRAIIQATGFEGLDNFDLEVVDRFDTKAAKIVVIGLDGAEPSVPISKLKAALTAAEALTEKRQSHTTHLQLGPEVSEDVTYTMRPDQLDDSKRVTKYFFFASSNQNLAKVSAPQIGFPEAFTMKRPYQHINVSIIQDRPDGQLRNGIDADLYAVGVEAGQTSNLVELDDFNLVQRLYDEPRELSYLRNPNIPNPARADEIMLLLLLAEEIENNSVGTAWAYAHSGVSYNEYAAAVKHMTLAHYDTNGAKYRILPPDEYADFQAA
jgi:hypothetical protein